MKRIPDTSWSKILSNELKKPYFSELIAEVDLLCQTSTVYPKSDKIFKAFEYCPFTEVLVVILGQDPYHGENQAQGLAFSVPDGVSIPPSLKNIYKELTSDLGIQNPSSGNLKRWAQQGLLLLNSTLTVEADKAGSHQGLGWEQFTDAVIKTISDKKEHVVFLLWGAHAIKKRDLVDETKHLVLTAPHPSPLSAYRGFFGCKHFSKTNEYLQKHNLPTITW